MLPHPGVGSAGGGCPVIGRHRSSRSENTDQPCRPSARRRAASSVPKTVRRRGFASSWVIHIGPAWFGSPTVASCWSSRPPYRSADVIVAMYPAPGADTVDRSGTSRMVTPWPAGVRAVVLPWTRAGGHGGWTTTAAAGNDFGRHSTTIEHMFDSGQKSPVCPVLWSGACRTPRRAGHRLHVQFFMGSQ